MCIFCGETLRVCSCADAAYESLLVDAALELDSLLDDSYDPSIDGYDVGWHDEVPEFDG